MHIFFYFGFSAGSIIYYPAEALINEPKFVTAINDVKYQVRIIED